MEALRRADLIRGEGEWRNMQPIVRSTFKTLLDQVDRQQQQIEGLLEIALNLKAQLTLRPSVEEVERVVADKLRQLPRSVSKEKHEAVVLSLQELRSEVERRATVQYVDDCLRRKIDRSDSLVRQMATKGTEVQEVIRGHFREESKHILAELGQAKSRHEALFRTVTELSREVSSSGGGGGVAGGPKDVRAQLNFVSNEVQELGRRVGAMNYEAVTRQLHAKADRAEVDQQLSLKMDHAAASLALCATERALAEHERLLTSLRLRPMVSASTSSSSSLAGGGGAAANLGSAIDDPLNASLFGLDGPGEREGVGAGPGVLDDSMAHYDQTHAQADGDKGLGLGLGGRLRAGRGEIVMASLWQRLQALARDVGGARGDARQMRGRLDGLEAAVNACAGVAQTEALAVIAEEQKATLDGLLSGKLRPAPLEDVSERLEEVERAVLPSRDRGGAQGGAKPSHKDKDKDSKDSKGSKGRKGPVSLVEATEAQAQALDGMTQRVVAVEQRVSVAEKTIETHARGMLALGASSKEGRDDLGDELRALRDKVVTMERVIQRADAAAAERETARLKTSRGLGIGLAADGGIGAGDDEAPFASSSTAGAGAGAASVDARIALLLAEKSRLRNQL